MPKLTDAEATSIIDRRHPEWREFNRYWRWMLDSLEGGSRYRNASYGSDMMGQPVRNLIRHKREYPDPRVNAQIAGSTFYPGGVFGGAGSDGIGSLFGGGLDAAQYATNDDYELRRARTPIPTFTKEAIEKHLGKIFSKEVSRKGPPDLENWWLDVDGLGTPVGDWIEAVVSPLFLLLGQIDILVDHPPAPDGIEIGSRLDQEQLGLHLAVATHILPENLLWWKLKPNGTYSQVLIQEYNDAGNLRDGDSIAKNVRYRYWEAEGSTLIDNDGKVVNYTPHGYGRVPIIRIFDRRKARCKNIGQSRYEAIADRQREYYNRDSELILSDTVQAHPLLQGPEDYVQADGTIPIGPGWLLPKKKNTHGGSATYEGFSVVEFPKGGADSIRLNKHDIRDEVDRDSKMTKPAGVNGTGKTTVAQSGVSKQLDNADGHDLCVQVAKSIGRLEDSLAELVLTVLRDGRVKTQDLDLVNILYPTTFDLESSDELSKGLADFQSLLAATGKAPETEIAWLKAYVRTNLRGLSQIQYATFDAEIEQAVNENAKLLGQMAEGQAPTGRSPLPDPNPPGNADDGATEESSGSPNYVNSPGYSARGVF